jgi:hypothetical protein
MHKYNELINGLIDGGIIGLGGRFEAFLYQELMLTLLTKTRRCQEIVLENPSVIGSDNEGKRSIRKW